MNINLRTHCHCNKIPNDTAIALVKNQKNIDDCDGDHEGLHGGHRSEVRQARRLREPGQRAPQASRSLPRELARQAPSGRQHC